MPMIKTLAGATAAMALLAGAAMAELAIIFDLGGKFDKERWVQEFYGSYKELEMQDEAKLEQALRHLAESGADPIFIANPIARTGFAFGDVLAKVAPEFPKTRFDIIDVDWLDVSNEPLIVSAENMVNICAYYSAPASLHQGHTWIMMKYGSMERFYAAYDQIKCQPRDVLPLERVIEIGNYQIEDIMRDLEGLAALPEAQRLKTINRTYKFAGRNQTMLDRVNRLVRDFEEDNILPDHLDRVKKYQAALVAMGAKTYKDL